MIISDSDNPIKICLVSPIPPPYGGMAIQAEKLASCLRKRGVNVVIARTNIDFPGGLKYAEKIPLIRTFLNTALFLFYLRKKIHHADIVYFLTGFIDFFLWITLTGIKLVKLYGKILILNARGGGAAVFFDHWKWLSAPFIRAADLITVPSGFLQEVFWDYFAIKAEIIPNIADLDQFEFKKRQVFRPRLIVTRSLEKIYNVECAVLAFRLIQEAFPDSRLDILGDGTLREELENKVLKWGLSEVVKFHGMVDHGQIQNYYDDADIFINASNVDNLPGTILEAFACGLPVVSTNAGGIPYMVEHGKTGLLVDKNDHNGLAAAVLQLLENQDMASALVSNARKECEKYSEQSVTDRLVSLFAEIR